MAPASCLRRDRRGSGYCLACHAGPGSKWSLGGWENKFNLKTNLKFEWSEVTQVKSQELLNFLQWTGIIIVIGSGTAPDAQ